MASRESELTRFLELKEYDLRIRRGEDHLLLAGVDEAGRGSLCGPVVAAAVILPGDFFLLGVDDSKRLSPRRREALFRKILRGAVCWAIGASSPHEIDRLNIKRAAEKAMREAVLRLKIKPSLVLVDGFPLSDLPFPQVPVVGGDGKSLAIAASSIIAKVVRDRMMVYYHRRYPCYDLIHNKGYGTKRHLAALREQGPSPIHRLSFNWRG
ncbi:MAG: ribonuclease HII [Acidobacteria bacterium]|nr:ribonuclease HII [Acidobacteriota bacterium]